MAGYRLHTLHFNKVCMVCVKAIWNQCKSINPGSQVSAMKQPLISSLLAHFQLKSLIMSQEPYPYWSIWLFCFAIDTRWANQASTRWGGAFRKFQESVSNLQTIKLHRLNAAKNRCFQPLRSSSAKLAALSHWGRGLALGSTGMYILNWQPHKNQYQT